jgi:hypothetical protein
MVSTLAELRPLSSQGENIKTSRLYCCYLLLTPKKIKKRKEIEKENPKDERIYMKKA